MAQIINRLSALKAQRLTANGMHGDGAGLYLQVTNDGRGKSWIFRYSLRGRTREMGFGSLAKTSLADARERAKEYHKLIDSGHDPIEHRERQRAEPAASASVKVMTFRECAEAYAASHRPALRNVKYARQWLQTLVDHAGLIGNMPVDVIDTPDVLKVLQPIWTTIPPTARHVRRRIETVLDYARVQGLRSGENPARLRAHIDHLLPKKSKVKAKVHHPALPYAELPAFMAKLREHDSVAAKALEFTILTAARTGEVLKARRAEINDKVWTVPGEHAKTGAEHRVPLCARAVELVSNTSDPLFAIAPNDMLRLLKRLGYSVTVHGFRSAFRDWAAEETSATSHVAEMALGHSISSAVEAAYRRGDLFEKRRQLMQAWSDYLDGSHSQKLARLVVVS